MSGITQPTNTDGQTATQTEVKPAEPTPVEKRINQLVGQFHEVKGQLDTVQGMNQQLMERNMQLDAELARMRSQAVVAPELPPLPDGTDSALVNAIAARVQAPLMQTISKLEQQLTGMVQGTSAQTEQLALQAAVAGEVPAVQQKVWDLYKEAKQKGYGGWTPQNLTWMARGMLAGVQPTAPLAPPQYGGGAPVPNPVVQQNNLPPAKTDAELKAMTSDQRIAYWESRVGDGEMVY